MSPEDIKLVQIFHPEAFRTVSALKLKEKKQRFVHYTNARAAASMLEKREFWLRNASCMNDYSEVRHGIDCLVSCWNGSDGVRLKEALDKMHPGFSERFVAYFDGHLPTIRDHTYVGCLSIHDPIDNTDEDIYGRLSMWRAYCNSGGVAIVMNNDIFFSEQSGLGAYSSPVSYFSNQDFKRAFAEVVNNIVGESEFLGSLAEADLRDRLFNAFLFACLCTKHPGYREELEYRIIHCPELHPSKHIERAVEFVREMPQIVYKIPLRNDPELGISLIEPHELFERVIIGPTNHNWHVTREAFVELLKTGGILDPKNKVILSTIPLRP